MAYKPINLSDILELPTSKLYSTVKRLMKTANDQLSKRGGLTRFAPPPKSVERDELEYHAIRVAGFIMDTRQVTSPSMPKLTFAVERYSPTGLANMSESDVRREYTRLRKQANAQLKALERSQFRDLYIVDQFRDRFKPLRDITNRRELDRLTQEVKIFLTKRSASVSGNRAIMRDNLRTLHTHGYWFVDESNWASFGRMMDELREQGYDLLIYRVYDEDPTAIQDALRELLSIYQQEGSISQREVYNVTGL